MKKYFLSALLIIPAIAFGQTENDLYKFSKDIQSGFEKDTTFWKYQLGATNFSISGYYKKALEVWDMDSAKKPTLLTDDSLSILAYRPVPAKDYIINRSKNERIVIINEAHHNSMHRTFTRSLLQGLYNNGYRYLGLEALFDTLINERHFATLESGFYTREPEFGNLLAEALTIGYTLFTYEAGAGKNNREREIEQAQNIKNFMDKHPDGKILIHCGYDHVIEGIPNSTSWEKAMAGWLAQFSGINPFTIDQVEYAEKGNENFNHPYLKMVNINSSSVLVNNQNKVFNKTELTDQVDCVVIHPKTKYENGRPTWLKEGRKPYKIPSSKIKKLPALILAYRTGEFQQKGVPADVLELTENRTSTLYLAKGIYDIIVKDENYTIAEQYTVTIK